MIPLEKKDPTDVPIVNEVIIYFVIYDKIFNNKVEK